MSLMKKRSNYRITDPQLKADLYKALASFFVVWVVLQAMFFVSVQYSVPAALDDRVSLLIATLCYSSLVFISLALIAMRLFNRISGPLHRIRTDLERMAESGRVEPVSIREDDHFSGLTSALNQVLVQTARGARANSRQHESS